MRYFLMRAGALEDIQQATATGRWTTAAQNLNAAYHNGDTVILVFGVHRHSLFCGYGRMASEAVPAATGGHARGGAPVQGGSPRTTMAIEWLVV